MSESASIACANLCKSFSEGGLNVDVLKGIDLSVEKGSCLAITGSSGCGKSTLLHLLGGLDDPTEGKVMVAGQIMSALSEQEKGDLRNSSLGFIYQFHHLLPEFTAIENVSMPLLIRGLKVEEAEQQAAEILERVGL
ncbi:MAG: ATP-binding cassette domain-containing protein, partial [Gammaproteobacteria bacterium]|nr:ATP-binding cassette domain-containing protein [Gammaproteobacteria bacterium]